MIKDFKHADITEKIIGCAMKVHSKMKNGHVESVYQKCMAIEFEKVGLSFAQEVDIPVYYEGKIVGRRRVDFIVMQKVSVELKAVAELTNTHLAQAINYLETHHLHIGLLINFGSKSLQFRRLINQEKQNLINH